MSYINDEERLSDPIDKICEGIAELSNAILARHKNASGWQAGHLKELSDLRNRILPFETELRLLQTQTR